MITKEKGCVYFIKHIGLEPIKIGYTKNTSPIDRFTQFKTYAPFGAELLGFIQSYSPRELESDLHNKYDFNRLEGEWFDITPTQVKKEILYYSNIDDIKDKNDFEIAWAKSKMKLADLKELQLIENKELLNIFVSSNSQIPIKKLCHLISEKFPNETKNNISNTLGISRNTLYKYLKL